MDVVMLKPTVPTNFLDRFRSVGTVLMLALLFTSATCQKTTRRPDRYLIPQGYVGWVRIDYKIPGTSELPLEDGYFSYEVAIDW